LVGIIQKFGSCDNHDFTPKLIHGFITGKIMENNTNEDIGCCGAFLWSMQSKTRKIMYRM
jgi:hypothetical protein